MANQNLFQYHSLFRKELAIIRMVSGCDRIRPLPDPQRMALAGKSYELTSGVYDSGCSRFLLHGSVFYSL